MERDIEMEEQLWKDPPWTCPVPDCGCVNLAIRERCRCCGFDSALVSGDCYFPVTNSDAPKAVRLKGGK